MMGYDPRIGELWAGTPWFQRQVDIAEASLKRFFTLAERPYLALSWGKQSIVVAHMIYQLRPETPMVFLRSWESYLLHDFERVMAEFTARWPINYIDYYCDNVSWNNYDWQRTRDLGSSDLQNMGDNAVPNWDGVVMGLAKDESKARRITTSLNTTPWRTIFQYKDGRYRCTPIQAWTLNDLAGYISRHDLPLLSAYLHRGLQARTTARITRMQAENNGLKDLKFRNISAYNTIVGRWPELAAK